MCVCGNLYVLRSEAYVLNDYRTVILMILYVCAMARDNAR
jgi:hypothetical protein